MRLIDADALIKQLEDMAEESRPIATARPMKDCTPAETVRMGVAKALISWLKETPTVNPWISVKERLPEEHADEHSYEFEQFLCSTVWDDVRMVGFGTRIGDDKPHFWSGNSIWDDWVTHWMPKPKPAKEETL